MKRLFVSFLLVALLLSLTIGAAAAAQPAWCDPIPPGAAHSNQHSNVGHIVVEIPQNAAANGGFLPPD